MFHFISIHTYARECSISFGSPKKILSIYQHLFKCWNITFICPLFQNNYTWEILGFFFFFGVLIEDEQAEISLKCFDIDRSKAGSQETSSLNLPWRNPLCEWGKAYIYICKSHSFLGDLLKKAMKEKNHRYYSRKHVKVFWPSEKRKKGSSEGRN